MPRETGMTKEDVEFMKMGEAVLKYIPQGKDRAYKWRKFKAYMEFYYRDMPNYLAKGEIRHHEK